MTTIAELEERIKNLEEALAYTQRDFHALLEVVANLTIEEHTHYTNIVHMKPLDDCEECSE